MIIALTKKLEEMDEGELHALRHQLSNLNRCFLVDHMCFSEIPDDRGPDCEIDSNGPIIFLGEITGPDICFLCREVSYATACVALYSLGRLDLTEQIRRRLEIIQI